jgi:hypothetical protein
LEKIEAYRRMETRVPKHSYNLTILQSSYEMSTNDQLFATILLASGLLMTPDHRAQLVALSKGVSTSAKPVEVVMQAETAIAPPPAEPKPKKIKPKSAVVVASMSLPPIPTNSSASTDFLAPVDLLPVSTAPETVTATETVTVATPVTTAATTIVSNSASNATYPNDALRTHRYRIASPDTKFCMARRWNEDAPIPGTETSAATSNGKMYPEQQCTRFPVAGTGICTLCAKAESIYKSNPADKPFDGGAKRWRGRLDGPMFANAPFLGSELFWKKYPQGLPGDPSTAAPAEWLAANTSAKPKLKTKAATVTTAAATTAAATTAAVTTAAVTTAAVTTAAVTTAAVTTTAVTTTATAAVATEVTSTATVAPMPVRPKAPVDEWVLALIGDNSYVYERSTLKCYEADMSITSSTKAMARLDRYAGKYESATNSVNIYGSESDEE